MARFQRFILSLVLQIMVSYILTLFPMCPRTAVNVFMDMSHIRIDGNVASQGAGARAFVGRMRRWEGCSCTTEWKNPYYSMFTLNLPSPMKEIWWLRITFVDLFKQHIASSRELHLFISTSSNWTKNNWRLVTRYYSCDITTTRTAVLGGQPSSIWVAIRGREGVGLRQSTEYGRSTQPPQIKQIARVPVAPLSSRSGRFCGEYRQPRAGYALIINVAYQ